MLKVNVDTLTVIFYGTFSNLMSYLEVFRKYKQGVKASEGDFMEN